MASVHKGAISFGLVHIPVSLHTATQDNDIHFNQLCREDGSRIRYKKVCSHCGKEVSGSEIVKGFEYADGQYVVMTDEDFEKAKTEQDRSIHILHFADLSDIRPVYFDTTYHVLPETGGDKAYELMRRAMLEESKVAIAKTVMRNAEKLLALIPTENEILIETLFFADEIKALPKEPARPALTDPELTMAKTLVNSMTSAFEPEQYHDEYQQRLRAIIEDKIQGKEIVKTPEKPQGTVIDIMEALQASLAQLEQPPKKSRGVRKKKETA